MPVRSVVKLACRLAVASTGRMMTIFDSHRVVDVIADHCMMDDRVDHCFSQILHAAKDF